MTKQEPAKKIEGEILFKTPLTLKRDQIVFKAPEIELFLLKHERNIKLKIQLSMPGTPTTMVTSILSRHKEEEIAEAEKEYKDTVQGLASGNTKIFVNKEGSILSFEIVNKQP